MAVWLLAAALGYRISLADRSRGVMSQISGYLPLAQNAATGIAKAFDKASLAAEQVTRAAAEFSNSDPVTLSPEAVAAARSGSAGTPKGDIERPMIDLRVAKYAAVASMRVLQTADEMAQELTQIGGRSRQR